MIKRYSVFVIFLAFFIYKGLSNPENSEQCQSKVYDKDMATLGKALVVGWTGETGKELVKALLKSSPFESITLAGRRTTDDVTSPIFSQKIVDFEALKPEDFKGHSHVFCLLGTTKGKSGAEGFVKVDQTFVQNVAQVSKSAGIEHFHLLTSTGSNSKSPFLYPATKGKVEEFCEALTFPKLTIYQPGLLLCPREQSRMGEFVFQKMMTPVHWAFGKSSGSIKTSMLADSMLQAAISGKTGKLSNSELHKLGEGSCDK